MKTDITVALLVSTVIAARDLVARARAHGRSADLGIVVTHRRGRFAVSTGASSVAGLTEADSVRAVEQIFWARR